MKRIIGVLIILILSSSSMPIKAEKYFIVDLTTGSIWVDLPAMYGAYLINQKYGHGGVVMQNYLTFSGVSADMENHATRTYIKGSSKNIDQIGSFKFPDILNGLGTCFKWGYKKKYYSFLKQFALYGSVGATYDHFYLSMCTQESSFTDYGNSILRLSPGIGANVSLGKPDAGVNVTFDFQLKYDLPIIYSGEFGDGAGSLKSGFSPKITLVFAGAHFRKIGVLFGISYEWSGYDLFKSGGYFIEPYNVKRHTFGMNFTIIPWK